MILSFFGRPRPLGSNQSSKRTIASTTPITGGRDSDVYVGHVDTETAEAPLTEASDVVELLLHENRRIPARDDFGLEDARSDESRLGWRSGRLGPGHPRG